jgi:hypothetical protein
LTESGIIAAQSSLEGRFKSCSSTPKAKGIHPRGKLIIIIIPTKISGLPRRLLCCLAFEEEGRGRMGFRVCDVDRR